MFDARVAGSSRPGPPVLGEVGAVRASGLYRRSRINAYGGEREERTRRRIKKRKRKGVCLRRGNGEEGNNNGKLVLFILQVARPAKRENAPEEPSVASQPLHSRRVGVCCRWTNDSFPHSDSEAAALQQAKKAAAAAAAAKWRSKDNPACVRLHGLLKTRNGTKKEEERKQLENQKKKKKQLRTRDV